MATNEKWRRFREIKACKTDTEVNAETSILFSYSYLGWLHLKKGIDRIKNVFTEYACASMFNEISSSKCRRE